MDGFPPETRVACYPRVSTEEQKLRGLSIEAQTSALQSWADQNGLKNITFYNDAGNSARKPYHKRPAMVRLLADVQAGKIDLIIFTKLDRWFRNIAEYYKVQEILEGHNVVWKAIQEDYDTSTASGRLKINIMLSVAQDEADRDSERIRAVFDAKRERREPLSGRVPTGYKIEGKKIVKDPGTEKAVACFFENFLTYRSIERARKAAAEYGVALSYQLASSMLRKKAYYGHYSGVDGMCPPYITEEQYHQIQGSRRKSERKTIGDRTYLFTGLVVCAECGRRFASRAHVYPLSGGGTGESIAYNCPGRYHHNDCSNTVNITEKSIETYLLNNVCAELERYSYELERMAAVRPVRNFQEERAKLRKRLAKLKDLYLEEMIDMEMYRKDYTSLNARLTALEKEEQSQGFHPAGTEQLKSLFSSGWEELYTQLSREEKQSFWRVAIDQILIYPTRHIKIQLRSKLSCYVI